jgi:hypothetical protein
VRINPNAAGIDVDAKEHVVAVPCDQEPQPVRTFQAFTLELHELARWLKRCGIETVALESTVAIAHHLAASSIACCVTGRVTSKKASIIMN